MNAGGMVARTMSCPHARQPEYPTASDRDSDAEAIRWDFVQ